MAIFKSDQSLYPYAVYDIQVNDIDKQENMKGELEDVLASLKNQLESFQLTQITNQW